MTSNQILMMSHLKICKEEFFSHLQLQHLLQQDQDQDLPFEDVFNDEEDQEMLFDDIFNNEDSADNRCDSLIHSALELASTILTRGSPDDMEHEETSLSLEAWLKNTSHLSTTLESEFEIDNFRSDSSQSSLEILDFDDKVKQCNYEATSVMEQLTTDEIDYLSDVRIEELFTSAMPPSWKNQSN
jgi:hypothetical protein